MADLLPGVSVPSVLANCHQLNCTGCNPVEPGGMKNVLAANAIALTLNIRYNVKYNGLTFTGVRNQGLDCIEMDPVTIPNIRYCPDNGICVFRVFDANGQHIYPYTIGGLLDLTNYCLGGNLVLSGGASGVIATALNEAVKRVNGYWNNGVVGTACDPGAGTAPVEGSNKSLPTGKLNPVKAIGFSLAPNPAGREVTFTLEELTESQEVTFEIYSLLGRQVLRKEFGKVRYLNERIDLSGIGSGLYLVSVKAGQQRFEKKLVIVK